MKYLRLFLQACIVAVFMQNGWGQSGANVTGLWISGRYAGSGQMISEVQKYPQIKKVVVPLFEIGNAVGSAGGVSTSYLRSEKLFYAYCHSRGIQVIGLFKPLYFAGRERQAVLMSRLPIEKLIRDAFDEPKPNSEGYLSIYSPATWRFADQCLADGLKIGQFDAVLCDVIQPWYDLSAGTELARQHCIEAFQLDPIDVNFDSSGRLPAAAGVNDGPIEDDRKAIWTKEMTQLTAIAEANHVSWSLYGIANAVFKNREYRADSLSYWSSYIQEHPGTQVLVGSAFYQQLSAAVIQQAGSKSPNGSVPGMNLVLNQNELNEFGGSVSYPIFLQVDPQEMLGGS